MWSILRREKSDSAAYLPLHRPEEQTKEEEDESERDPTLVEMASSLGVAQKSSSSAGSGNRLNTAAGSKASERHRATSGKDDHLKLPQHIQIGPEPVDRFSLLKKSDHNSLKLRRNSSVSDGSAPEPTATTTTATENPQAPLSTDMPNPTATATSTPAYPREHPAMWAISFHQLLQIDAVARKKFSSWKYNRVTMRDINHLIIIPRCNEFQTSYALSLNPQHGLLTDAFVTHCWDEPFAQFVQSIRTAFGPFTDTPNLWICAFALRQGSYKVVQEQLDVPLQQSPFVQALQAASWFVVVRNAKVDLYSRAWCVAELYYAREFGFTTSTCRHSTNDHNNQHHNHHQQQQQLCRKQSMVIGPDKFSHLRTSCVDAQAFNVKDKYKILRELQQKDGNLKAIDHLVLQYRKHGDYQRQQQLLTTSHAGYGLGALWFGDDCQRWTVMAVLVAIGSLSVVLLMVCIREVVS